MNDADASNSNVHKSQYMTNVLVRRKEDLSASRESWANAEVGVVSVSRFYLSHAPHASAPKAPSGLSNTLFCAYSRSIDILSNEIPTRTERCVVWYSEARRAAHF